MKARTPSIFRSLVAMAVLTLAVVAAPAGTAYAQASEPTHLQTADLQDLVSGALVPGAATLYRTSNGLELRIAASGLEADAAYSTWWVLWNNPELCSGPCDFTDLGIAGNSAFYATGFVTDSNGTANATASLASGHLPKGVEVVVPGPPLQPGNGLAAEVQFVIRSHGPLIVGSVAEQIGTFNGGCSVNACADELFGVFRAVR